LKKTLKVTGKVLAVFIILNLLGAGVLYTYFTKHKKELIKKASVEIGDRIMASVKVKDADISWFGTFPYLSLELKDVNIIDSSNSSNPIPFLEANHFLVSFDIFKLIKGNFHINRVLLSDGNINFIRDSNKISNLHILDEENPSKKASHPPKQTLFNFMTLNNIRVYLIDKSEQKKYDILVKHLTCESDFDDTVTSFKINMNTHINFLGLNILDGYYGKNKDIEGSFPLFLNSKSKILTLKKIKLYVDHEPVIADGTFHLDTAKHFQLDLTAKSISFENARTSLLEKTQQTLSMIKVSKPIDIEISMHGDTKYKSIPHVNLTFNIKDNILTSPGGKFAHCSMTGNFMNEVDLKLRRSDTNSMMTVTDFDALWNGISPIHSNKIIVNNLIEPDLNFDLQASCRLTDIDSLVQSDDVNLEEGIAKIDIVYKGPSNISSKIIPDITGNVSLSNAEILYVPHNMRLTKCNGLIAFHHTAISIRNLSGSLGNSSVSINGKVNSILPLFSNSKAEMLLNWDISSHFIDLTQLVPLISGRNHKHRNIKKEQKTLAGLSYAIDSFAEKCNIKTNFSISKIVYKRFEAQNVIAELSLNTRTGWKIQSLKLDHSGGNIMLNGSVVQSNDDNHKVLLDVDIHKVDVSKIFYAFDNFGISSFNYNNLKGLASLQANLQLDLNDSAKIIPNSLKGEASFRLENGELIDFKPIEEICAKIFPTRNFKDIQFAELKDKFTVANYKIKMDKMEIESNLIHLYAEGTYALRGNATDLTIQVPINNLEMPDYYNAPENKGLNAKTGLSVFIKAEDDGKGVIKFKYNSLGGSKKKVKSSKHDKVPSPGT